jgi:hypothetical protein
VNAFSLMLLAHVLFTTAGYAGLIASNVWLLLLVKGRIAAPVATSLTAWRTSSRIFGPLLGLGILIGFGLASGLHVPLASGWLIATYLSIAIAIAVAASVMVPWQIRTSRTTATGVNPPIIPVVAVLATQSLAYTAILALMLLRPV